MANTSDTSPKQVAPVTVDNAVAIGFGTKEGFLLSQQVASMLSKSTLVPEEYQGNISNCFIALNMANRMNADPLMVMQNLYIVYGRPGWSSQFLISTFNASGRFSALRYEWTGEKGKDNWGCRAWAYEKSSGEKLVGSEVTIAIAKAEGWYDKRGSKWRTMPEQMLMYRAASWFIRAYAPEIAMGMHTAEELHDVLDLTDDDFIVHEEIAAKANKEVLEEESTEKTEEKPKDSKDKPEQKVERGPGF